VVDPVVVVVVELGAPVVVVVTTHGPIDSKLLAVFLSLVND
jgi:hypothetical protein